MVMRRSLEWVIICKFHWEYIGSCWKLYNEKHLRGVHMGTYKVVYWVIKERREYVPKYNDS
jgi:hypothetical protein